MRFGKTLRKSTYEPWKEQYINYGKLKTLLREDVDDEQPWTEDDESRFCEEMLNVQLNKVAEFQASTFQSLDERASAASEKIRALAPEGGLKGDITLERFKAIRSDLDTVINEVKELKKYSNLNYTAILKIVKKHDRKRGSNYKIRPIVQMELARRPFNDEQRYSVLLNKLSTMYFLCTQQIEGTAEPIQPTSEVEKIEGVDGEKYIAEKFWIHHDNLLEVKTLIVRHLPILVYGEPSNKDNEIESDPTLNSLYFDNRDFSLYSQKVDRQTDASSLRIRWFGQLNSKPELVVEQKIVRENGTSEDKRFSIKEKYVQAFIKGEYKMEKSIQKMERQGQSAAKIEEFRNTVDAIQNFIKEKNLQPVLRANYTRTAYQKPLDDKIRVSIDTNLAFIREDALDSDRPCRDPNDWHRADIDSSCMTYPFKNINQGEVSKFPYAVLEIKIRDDGENKQPNWVTSLMASHLVYKSLRFSKFVHGVASLFEDHVNNLPFWLSAVETDIRKDPQVAFEEEEQRKAKRSEEEAVVGSFLGTSKASYKAAMSSPAGKSYSGLQERLESEGTSRTSGPSRTNGSRKSRDNDDETNTKSQSEYGTLTGLFPSFSTSRYAQARRGQKNVKLPPGVEAPTQYIKDAGSNKVEGKVWLANERTAAKWGHICVLLSGLALALLNSSQNWTAYGMSIVYLCVAVFAGAWGATQFNVRRTMIETRSGKDFDNIAGPLIVAFALMVALILNFILQWTAAFHRSNADMVDTFNTTGTMGTANIELK